MISYLKLQNDKEIIVMKSAGLSPLKISKPALLVASICSLILFIMSHFILPETYRNFKELQNEIRNSNQEFILKDNIFIDINKTQTIFIGKVKNSNSLEEIFIQDRTDNLYLVEYFSKRGNLNIGESIDLMMIEGTRISTDKKGRSTLLNFDNYNITIQFYGISSISSKQLKVIYHENNVSAMHQVEELSFYWNNINGVILNNKLS